MFGGALFGSGADAGGCSGIEPRGQCVRALWRTISAIVVHFQRCDRDRCGSLPSNRCRRTPRFCATAMLKTGGVVLKFPEGDQRNGR
jgi:hypothetical protein